MSGTAPHNKSQQHSAAVVSFDGISRQMLPSIDGFGYDASRNKLIRGILSPREAAMPFRSETKTKKLTFEILEPRDLLAALADGQVVNDLALPDPLHPRGGNLTAKAIDGTLYITGDDAGNQLQIGEFSPGVVLLQSPLVTISLQLTGTDGRPLTSLAAGQEFVLHAYASDMRKYPHGVFAAYMDVDWDASLAKVVGPISYGFDYGGGNSGDVSTPGLIDEVGSFASVGELKGGDHEVFSVRLQATGSGDLRFTTNSADLQLAHDVLVYSGSAEGVDTSLISYGTASVQVAPGDGNIPSEDGPKQDTNQTVTKPVPDDQVVASYPDNTLTAITLRLTDANGQALTSLAPGQEFVLHVYATDTRSDPHGVFAAYMDVNWDASLAKVIGPISYGADYWSGRSGNVSTPGQIDEGGAFAGIVELKGGAHEVFSVHLQATAAGQLAFATSPADLSPSHDVLIYKWTTHGIDPANIFFGTTGITIGSGSSSEPAASVPSVPQPVAPALVDAPSEEVPTIVVPLFKPEALRATYDPQSLLTALGPLSLPRSVQFTVRGEPLQVLIDFAPAAADDSDAQPLARKSAEAGDDLATAGTANEKAADTGVSAELDSTLRLLS